MAQRKKSQVSPSLEERISSRGFLLGRGKGSGAFPQMGQREEIFLLERLRLTYEGPSSSRRRDPSWDHGCSSVAIDFPRHGHEGKSERNSTRKQRRNLTPPWESTSAQHLTWNSFKLNTQMKFAFSRNLPCATINRRSAKKTLDHRLLRDRSFRAFVYF